jgi:hypothetical protein
MSQMIAEIFIQKYGTNSRRNQKLLPRMSYSYHTFKFLTWWGHPAGMKTASPSFCSNVQGSTPEYGVYKKLGSKSLREILNLQKVIFILN